MNRMAANVAKGMAVGAAIGSAVWLAAQNSGRSQTKKIKKGAAKAVKSVSDVVDNLYTMLK